MYRYGVALMTLALVLTACAGGGGQAPTVVVGGGRFRLVTALLLSQLVRAPSGLPSGVTMLSSQ